MLSGMYTGYFLVYVIIVDVVITRGIASPGESFTLECSSNNPFTHIDWYRNTTYVAFTERYSSGECGVINIVKYIKFTVGRCDQHVHQLIINNDSYTEDNGAHWSCNDTTTTNRYSFILIVVDPTITTATTVPTATIANTATTATKSTTEPTATTVPTGHIPSTATTATTEPTTTSANTGPIPSTATAATTEPSTTTSNTYPTTTTYPTGHTATADPTPSTKYETIMIIAGSVGAAVLITVVTLVIIIVIYKHRQKTTASPGESLTLECSSNTSFTYINWYRNNIHVASTERYSSGECGVINIVKYIKFTVGRCDQHDHQLIINNVSYTEDNGAQWSCNSTIASSFILSVVGPETTTVTTLPSTSPGEPFILECSSNKPVTLIDWYRNNIRVAFTEIYSSGECRVRSIVKYIKFTVGRCDQYAHQLIINNVSYTEDNGAHWSCNDTTTNSFILSVVRSETTTANTSPDTITAAAHTTATTEMTSTIDNTDTTDTSIHAVNTDFTENEQKNTKGHKSNTTVIIAASTGAAILLLCVALVGSVVIYKHRKKLTEPTATDESQSNHYASLENRQQTVYEELQTYANTNMSS